MTSKKKIIAHNVEPFQSSSDIFIGPSCNIESGNHLSIYLFFNTNTTGGDIEVKKGEEASYSIFLKNEVEPTQSLNLWHIVVKDTEIVREAMIDVDFGSSIPQIKDRKNRGTSTSIRLKD